MTGMTGERGHGGLHARHDAAKRWRWPHLAVIGPWPGHGQAMSRHVCCVRGTGWRFHAASRLAHFTWRRHALKISDPTSP
jgi:hypothetical protein